MTDTHIQELNAQMALETRRLERIQKMRTLNSDCEQCAPYWAEMEKRAGEDIQALRQLMDQHKEGAPRDFQDRLKRILARG